MKDPDLWRETRREIEDAFPDLELIQQADGVYLTGWFPVWEGNEVLDRYHVRVRLSPKSSRHPPEVWEIDGRLPRDPDRHVEDDGKACVVLPDAFWYENPKGMALTEFLRGPLRSFLANQSLIEAGLSDSWESDQWGHGAKGIYEFYARVTGIKDPMVLLRFLELLSRPEAKGHWSCPCGRGERVRSCHGPLLRNLRSRIPQSVAARSSQLLQDEVAKAVSKSPSRTL